MWVDSAVLQSLSARLLNIVSYILFIRILLSTLKSQLAAKRDIQLLIGRHVTLSNNIQLFYNADKTYMNEWRKNLYTALKTLQMYGDWTVTSLERYVGLEVVRTL